MEYFYGQEANQFIFYRIPKALIVGERYKELRCEAKLLYGLLLDRTALSGKNGWLDQRNRVYVYYTIKSIMEDMGCKHEKAGKLLAELETHDLIMRIHQGLGKPDRIYVGKIPDL